MKKSISIVLAALLVLSLGIIVSADDAPQVILTANSEEVNAGDTVTLTLSLSKALENISCFEYYVGYNPEVLTYTGEFTVADACKDLVAVGTPPEANYEKSDTYSALTVSAVKLNGDGKFTLTKGEIATITFTANDDDAAGDNGGVAVNEVAVCDSTFKDDAVAVSTADAPSVIIGYALGDANVDGKVDVGDVQRVYLHIRKENLITDEIQKKLADFVKNDTIDKEDVKAIFELILGKKD